jgi:phage tail-like protein
MGLIQKTSSISAPAAVTFSPMNVDDGELPVPIYQFAIEIDDVTVALFQKVSGMSISREVEPLKVGGENNYGREFPGHVSYGHIKLEVGLSSSDFFYKWMVQGDLDGYAHAKDFTLVQRRPQPDPSSASDEEKIFEVVKTWDFMNAFPVSWQISELGITDSKNIVIETLELSFDYFLLA